MVELKKIAVTSRSKDKKTRDIALQCCEILSNQDIKILMSKHFEPLSKFSKKINFVSDNVISNSSDLIICIGGDGTMLSSARKFSKSKAPLLGINLGKVGFLTDFQPHKLAKSLNEVLQGKYLKDDRFFLEGNINKSKRKLIALNEIVIHSGAIAQMIDYEVYINNNFVYSQKSDGLIVNSPTGSTAYSLSGGGPIIYPSVDALTLLPILPQSLSSSPIVVPGNSKIEIIIGDNRNKAILSIDSHDKVELRKGDKVLVKKSSESIALIHPKDHDFYASCRNKLGWSKSL